MRVFSVKRKFKMKPLSFLFMVLCYTCLILNSESKGLRETRYENINQKDFKLEDKGRLLKRSASNIVDIAMFTQTVNQTDSYSIYIDSTIKTLKIEIRSDGTMPVSSLLKPSGNQAPHPRLNVNSGTITANFDVAITPRDYGIWKLEKIDASSWHVKVQGESTLDFTYSFLKGNLMKTVLKGNPIQDEEYTTEIDVADYSQIRSVDNFLVFVTEKFSPAKFPIVKRGPGKYELAKLQMLERDFMIGIQGKDNTGYTFRRVKLVKPIALLLLVPFLTEPASKLFEQTRMEIQYTVTNKLSKKQDVDIRITDTQSLAQPPLVISATIKPGENYTGKFVLDGGLLGVETIVEITATPYHGPGQKSVGPSVKRYFKIEINQTTTTSSRHSKTVAKTTQTSLSIIPKSSNSVSLARTSNGNSIRVLTTTSFNQKTKGSVKSAISTVMGQSTLKMHAGNNVSHVNGQPNSATPSNGRTYRKSFSSKELFGAASVSGLSTGILIGVAALLTIVFVLRKSINKKKVAPITDMNKKEHQLDLSWT